jgi:FtsP/CotA-like multicopper oxidase with cupredoxin domain
MTNRADDSARGPAAFAGAAQSTDRRDFLKVAAAAGVAIPGTAALAQVAQPVRQLRRGLRASTWHIQAARVVQTFMDGTTLPYYRFVAQGTTKVAGTMPVLDARAGSVMTLRVSNTLPVAIQPTIIGGATGPVINPGEDVSFQIQVPSVGTWLLTDALLGDAAGPMGLGAVVIARPAAVKARWTAHGQVGVAHREYVLAYTDSDDRWNNAIDTGGAPNYAFYEPNYHTLNNLSFPDTVSDPGTTINCRVGETVLLRMCNFGFVRQSLHFHGYHVNIKRVNNTDELNLGSKDTVGLPGQTTMEVELPVLQAGSYPLHPHSLTMVTDNGLYVAGQLTLIVAT